MLTGFFFNIKNLQQYLDPKPVTGKDPDDTPFKNMAICDAPLLMAHIPVKYGTP